MRLLQILPSLIHHLDCVKICYKNTSFKKWQHFPHFENVSLYKINLNVSKNGCIITGTCPCLSLSFKLKKFGVNIKHNTNIHKA